MKLSGERFKVIYSLTGNAEEARKKAKDICYEQTVEFPEDLIPSGIIKEEIVGKIEDLIKIEENRFKATISYAIEITGFEITQILNVIFGNISIKPGIKVENIQFSDLLLKHFKGPRFGRSGIRKLLDVPNRPILCTALKPMGLSPQQLADFAYQFAKGGIDIIKDDHGIANQEFCPLEKRIKSCCEAVEKANRETGYNCLYMPNIGGPLEKIRDKIMMAKETGVGGLLLCPGLIGFDICRQLTENDDILLPVLAHPALLGSFVTSRENGISHGIIFGQLMRLIGADAIIYPNYGGRFSFTPEECKSIVEMTQSPMAHFSPIFPAPAGGMTIDRIPEMLDFYGNEVIFLIGGDLHRHGKNLIKNSKKFKKLVESL
ncbi:MAG: RuBisCO large subunit C-terminal-like domain-containing protein [Promethearchaeota archaeon]